MRGQDKPATTEALLPGLEDKAEEKGVKVPAFIDNVYQVFATLVAIVLLSTGGALLAIVCWKVVSLVYGWMF